MRKQFDLEYYLEHPETKVETREGRSVRILDTCFMGLEGEYIVVKIKSPDGKLDWTYILSKDGKYFDDRDSELDLFFGAPGLKKNRVPLTHEDLLQRVQEGKTMWVSLDNKMDTLLFISSFDRENLFLFAEPVCEYQGNHVLMECEYYFIDGTPCWKEIDGGSDDE